MIATGIVVMLAGFIVATYLLAFTDRNAISALSLFGLTIVAGIAIPNIPRIQHVGAETETGKSSIGLDMLQAVTEVKSGVAEVQTDKGEVTQIKNEVQTLAQQVTNANSRVSQSEQNVAQMQANVRQAYRSLFDTLVVSLETRGTFPPPQEAIDEINRELNILAAFAFPDPAQATVEWQRLHVVGARVPQDAITLRPNPEPKQASPTSTAKAN
jgi:hypothetical protein